MRKAALYLLLLLTLWNTKALAQKDTVYFGDWMALAHSEDAKYYGFVSRHDGKYYLSIYFLTGELHMTGSLSAPDLPMIKHRDGWFTYYDIEGKKTSEGACKNGVRTGKWTYYDRKSDNIRMTEEIADDQEAAVKNLEEKRLVSYYDMKTGKVRRSGMMIGKKMVGAWKVYYRNSDKVQLVVTMSSRTDGTFVLYDKVTQNKMGEGEIKNGKLSNYEGVESDVLDNSAEGVQDVSVKVAGPPVVAAVHDTIDKIVGEGTERDGVRTGQWKYYKRKGGEIIFTCNYTNGFLDGELLGYYPGGKIRRKEQYVSGDMRKGACYSRDGKEVEYFSSAEAPEFRGNLSNYIIRSIHYPERARKKAVAGKVVVRFLVNEDGHISDPYIITGIGSGCDEEAMRVVANMDDWHPGTVEGVPVKMYIALPIVFKIPEQR